MAEPASNQLSSLPDELLEAIVSHLPPTATLSFGTTCSRANKITYEPLVWRRHCTTTWRYWEKHHNLDEKLVAPPMQTKWRQLYNERRRIDREAEELFNCMLETQQWRFERMEKITSSGFDVKDLMLKQRDATPDDAEDVLCRRYHANAILGQIHRATALEKWSRLQRRQMVRLEEILGAYDLFVLSGQRGDLDDMDRELDRLAAAIRARDEEFDHLSTRRKAIQIAKFLRSENLVGNASEEDYHALRNNFITMALFDDEHTSLPLQSVAIYCAVARRLGVNAKPSNYPQHVHAVIEAPADQTLEGRPKAPTSGDETPELMHMDPWRSSEEVPAEQLNTRLLQMGAPPAQHQFYLGGTTNLEIAMRTSRNIMHSVQESRERQRGITRRVTHPDVEAAWYSMLWSMLILGDSNSATTLHRRRQCLPYLVDHFQAHFPEDIGLVEKYIPPMFDKEREHSILLHLITSARTTDQNRKPPCPRSERTQGVHHKIGTHFKHRRYGYEGVIVGWDVKCGAEQRWMEQMRVDDLPRGREQPFYNSVAEDKSVRYVAEENIEVDETEPSQLLMELAGKYFKRWDKVEKRFISNIMDEYPDD